MKINPLSYDTVVFDVIDNSQIREPFKKMIHLGKGIKTITSKQLLELLENVCKLKDEEHNKEWLRVWNDVNNFICLNLPRNKKNIDFYKKLALIMFN